MNTPQEQKTDMVFVAKHMGRYEIACSVEQGGGVLCGGETFQLYQGNRVGAANLYVFCWEAASLYDIDDCLTRNMKGIYELLISWDMEHELRIKL